MNRTILRTLATLAAAAAAHVAPAEAADARSDWLEIELGKSVVIETPKNATAIAITDPNIADIVPLASANKIQVQGKTVGTTDLVIQQGPGVQPLIYEVTVSQDLSDLIRRVDAIVEGEPPNIYPLKERIVVQGPVDDLDTLERVAQVAEIYDEEFVNLMTVRGDHQVQLEVLFAEVSRSKLREMGLNILWEPPGQSYAVGVVGPRTSGLGITDPNGNVVYGAAPGAFQIYGGYSALGLLGVISILDEYRLSKILAQPTIVCMSGQQGEFLAGGEIPLPAASSNGTITIQFREYGVKTLFVPTVLAGNVVDMRVYVEVSEPDYANSASLTGLTLPAFISRKSKTHLRLSSGMTFAMAGLLNESVSFERASIPVLGKLPVIGALFRYVQHDRDETELIMFVTPRLVRPLGPGEVPAAPGTTENNNPSDLELFLLGMDHQAGSRTAEPTGAVGLQR